MSEKFWLVTTEHLKDGLWFQDEEDFKTGMSYVAVTNILSGVGVMAFVLMSNHVHFVLGGSEDEAQFFINHFKRFYSRYFHFKYSSTELLRNNSINLRELNIGDGSFEKAVAYVHMNPVAANICSHPIGYPWGTGTLFFSGSSIAGKRVDAFSKRSLYKITHSKVAFPPEYIVDERGFVSPVSYVQKNFVESVFRSPNRMNFFLKNSSKAKNNAILPTFKDQSALAGMYDLCNSLFRKSSICDLTQEQKAELLKQMRYRFSADPKQLSRITGLSQDSVMELLDTFNA